VARFNCETQFGPTPGTAGTIKEEGVVTLASADVDGATFTIASKLHRIKGGFAVRSDGLLAVPTLGVCSGGQVTFTTKGTINDTTPTVTYVLWGT